MNFSAGLFWDTDETKFDFDKHAGHIIPRVFMKGKLNDILQVIRYYGKEKIKEVLTNTRYLDKKTLSFAIALFDLKKEDFRCYKLSQSTPQHWNY